MAADSRKTRKSNFSAEEKDVLISTVMHNYDILYGETSKSYYHKEARNQVWNIVLEEVNKVSLEKRTLAEVKNKWKKCQHNVNKTDESVDNSSYTEYDDLDSMPLQQRLSQNSNQNTSLSSGDVSSGAVQEPVLQSQPISPTKLKVTRQGAKPSVNNYPKDPPPILIPEKICLKWDSHHVNMQLTFPNLLLKEQYVDATLVSEGKTLKCHRMILSSCSSYFEEVLSEISPLQHPVLFMKDTPFWILKALCDFMYSGEVHILQDKLDELLAVANTLKIKGLTETKNTQENNKIPVPLVIKEEKDAVPCQIIKKEPPKETEKTQKIEQHPQENRNRRKEDKKSKHQSNQNIKDPVMEESTSKSVSKLLQKVVPKVVQKMLPKASNQRSSVKGVSKTSTSKNSRDGSKKNDKQKRECSPPKDKEKDKPLKKNAHINDPLDLLEPVYEEIAKEEPANVPTKNVNPVKLKEQKSFSLKKGIRKIKEDTATSRKKVKKRRYADYVEGREESPSPTFQSRKGTRSRPNVKIPKFFHTTFEDSPSKEHPIETTIVRVPHTDQNDPLIGAEINSIKAEPVDVEENTIEVEENMVNFIAQEITSQEGEEIIGSYDSPIVNIQREGKRNTPNIFKKILVTDPVIMAVHTVTESHHQSTVGLLNINEENVQLVDIAKISAQQTESVNSADNLEVMQDKTSLIKITNVQSIADNVKNEAMDSNSVPPEEDLRPPIANEEFQENRDHTEKYYNEENEETVQRFCTEEGSKEMHEELEENGDQIEKEFFTEHGNKEIGAEELPDNMEHPVECSQIENESAKCKEDGNKEIVNEELERNIDHPEKYCPVENELVQSEENVEKIFTEDGNKETFDEDIEGNKDRPEKHCQVENESSQNDENFLGSNKDGDIDVPMDTGESELLNFPIDGAVSESQNSGVVGSSLGSLTSHIDMLTFNSPIDDLNTNKNTEVSHFEALETVVLNQKTEEEVNLFREEIHQTLADKSVKETGKIDEDSLVPMGTEDQAIRDSENLHDSTGLNENSVNDTDISSIPETSTKVGLSTDSKGTQEPKRHDINDITSNKKLPVVPNESESCENDQNLQETVTKSDDSFTCPNSNLEEKLLAFSPEPDACTSTSVKCTVQDENKLEESLLEMEEDVIMTDASNVNRGADVDPEKTLEMIVNDLNASLGTSHD